MRQPNGFERTFSTPTFAPLYGAPPVEYRQSRLLSLLLRTTPEAIQALLPSPLVANPERLLLMNINLLDSDLFGAYNEVLLSVPCQFETTIGQYCLVLYVDSDAAIAAGREIWGFPKKQARITDTYTQTPERYTITVARGGTTLMSVELTQLVPVERTALVGLSYGRWLQLQTWFNYKLIPAVTPDGPPAVEHLTCTHMEGLTLQPMQQGNPRVTFGSSATDPLDRIPIQEVMAGFTTRATGVLTYGHVLYDYLTGSVPAA
jgi:acetoacetate decarboxylase